MHSPLAHRVLWHANVQITSWTVHRKLSPLLHISIELHLKRSLFCNKKTIHIEQTTSKQKTKSVHKCHKKSRQHLHSPYKPSPHIMLQWQNPIFSDRRIFSTCNSYTTLIYIRIQYSSDHHALLPCWDTKHMSFHSSTLHISSVQA